MSSTPILSLGEYARAVARLARPFARPETELGVLGLDAARYEQAGREWTAVLRVDPMARREFSRLYREAGSVSMEAGGHADPAPRGSPTAAVNVDETAMGAVPAVGPILPFVDGTFRPTPESAPPHMSVPSSEPNPDETQALGVVLDLTLPFGRSGGARSVASEPNPPSKNGPSR
jgi:hypothetical protein